MESYAIWAARVLMLAAAAFVLIIVVRLGLPWPLAIITISLMLMTFLCVARIVAETGVANIQVRWQALGMLFGLMGGYALEPRRC